MRPPPIRQIRVPAAALGLLFAPPAFATDLQATINDLDAASVQTRIEAQTRLANDSGVSLKQIEAFLKAGHLSAEQRERLLAAAYAHFVNEPRGAMGIRPSNTFEQRGAALDVAQPQFPAAAVLRTGDRITAADGLPIDTFEALRAVILSHDPGDEVPVTLVRASATLNVSVKLGSFGDLKDPNRTSGGRPDSASLAQAWAVRARPYREAGDGAPIPCSVPVTAWTQASFDETEPSPVRVADGDISHTSVIAGGEARGGTQPASVLQGSGGRVINQINLIPQPQGADAARVQLDLKLQVLQAQHQALANQISQLRQKLLDPRTPESMRSGINGQIELKTRELHAHDLEIQQIGNQLFNHK